MSGKQKQGAGTLEFRKSISEASPLGSWSRVSESEDSHGRRWVSSSQFKRDWMWEFRSPLKVKVGEAKDLRVKKREAQRIWIFFLRKCSALQWLEGRGLGAQGAGTGSGIREWCET